SLHLFVEADVQRAVRTLPGLTSLFGVAYLTLHLAVTAGVLLWLHRRRPDGFPFVRTAVLLASGLALIGFLVYPPAPPRLPGGRLARRARGRARGPQRLFGARARTQDRRRYSLLQIRELGHGNPRPARIRHE